MRWLILSLSLSLPLRSANPLSLYPHILQLNNRDNNSRISWLFTSLLFLFSLSAFVCLLSLFFCVFFLSFFAFVCILHFVLFLFCFFFFPLESILSLSLCLCLLLWTLCFILSFSLSLFLYISLLLYPCFSLFFPCVFSVCFCFSCVTFFIFIVLFMERTHSSINLWRLRIFFWVCSC